LSFRDALVVVGARKSAATLLLSDLRPFRPIAGLDVRNPFA
jgi:predicted nucleic acid-binding protein